MRTKDEHKQEAIIKATIKLVNRIGFVSSSVSKIAKEADVSPATIYIYYKNKEDLLVSIYTDIKIRMSTALLEGFDESLEVKEILRKTWSNGFRFIRQNRESFFFTEQFSNSPFSSLVNKKEVEAYFKPLIDVLKRGISEGIIKDVDFDLLATFMFFPIFILSNPSLCSGFEITDNNIGKAFDLAWDAIKK